MTLLPASIIAGVLYDRAGSAVPFYFGGAMAFLAALLMALYVISGRRKSGVKTGSDKYYTGP
jgi:uncharacterized protein (TIGR03382 family)